MFLVLVVFCCLIVWDSLSLGPWAHQVRYSGWPLSLEIYLSLLLWRWDYMKPPHLAFYMGAGDWVQVLILGLASVLPTKPFPRSPLSIFILIQCKHLIALVLLMPISHMNKLGLHPIVTQVSKTIRNLHGLHPRLLHFKWSILQPKACTRCHSKIWIIMLPCIGDNYLALSSGDHIHLVKSRVARPDALAC